MSSRSPPLDTTGFIRHDVIARCRVQLRDEDRISSRWWMAIVPAWEHRPGAPFDRLATPWRDQGDASDVRRWRPCVENWSKLSTRACVHALHYAWCNEIIFQYDRSVIIVKIVIRIKRSVRTVHYAFLTHSREWSLYSFVIFNHFVKFFKNLRDCAHCRYF